MTDCSGGLMTVDIFDLNDRLSRGENVWPFGGATHAIVVSYGLISVSVPFSGWNDFPRALKIAGNQLVQNLQLP